MYVKNTLLIVLSIFVCSAFKSDNITTVKIPNGQFKNIKVPEPSDVVKDLETGHLFIVSDDGLLYECDAQGNIIRKAKKTGWDFEAVELKGDDIFVSDESARKVYRYNKKDLSLTAIYKVPYSGARNSGFESLAYNPDKKVFILVSEKDPVTIYEMDSDFHFLREYDFNAARDISSARWYNGNMYLLSDEDMCILKCNSKTYEVEARYKFNILNPEGLTFDNTGKVIISADDLQRLYFLNNLPAGNE